MIKSNLDFIDNVKVPEMRADLKAMFVSLELSMDVVWKYFGSLFCLHYTEDMYVPDIEY